MSKKIKLVLPTGVNTDAREQTELGVIMGEEIVRELHISLEDAQELIQDKVINILNYEEAAEFYRKYHK